MKRCQFILLVLFLILGCQSEIEPNINTNKNAIPMSFYAGVEIPKDSGVTKTVLDGTPSDAFRSVLWEHQDEVYVSNGSQSSKFVNTTQGTSEIALLEGDLAEGTDYFAAYPYDMVKALSSSEMTIELPTVQTYYNDGIEPGIFTMVARSEDGEFNFKNLCGIFVVQLLGEHSISSITFSGKDSSGNAIPVSGQGKVSMNYSDAPSLKMNSSSSSQVTLSCPEGVALDHSIPTTFHIILPAGTYNTFEIVITANDGSQMIVESDKDLSVIRSKRTTTTALEFSPSVINSEYYIDEYGVNHGPGVKIDDTVWAPVNCGYHETDYPWGKLYQWGRKYGQGYDGSLYDMSGDKIGTYSDSSVPNVDSGPVSLRTGQSKNNENIFYMPNSGYYDWLTPIDDQLWNLGTESNPIKTEHDPCPKGWRVPTYRELSKLRTHYSSWVTKENQPGYWFSGSLSFSSSVNRVFFPASGFRNSNSGMAYNRGNYGYYWCSCPYKTYAYYLVLGSNNVSMYGNSFSNCRADASSVRCVRE